MSKLTDFIAKLAWPLRLSPISLAGKCRLQFGGAIVLVLALALWIPYYWMTKLTEKALLDSGKAVVNTVYAHHFKPATPDGSITLAETGAAGDANDRAVRWLRFAESIEAEQVKLSKMEKKQIEILKSKEQINERAWINKANDENQTTYINLVRAGKNCLSCHNADGPAEAFNLNETVGAIIVRLPSRHISRAVLLNRICIIAAGLLAGAGAIVAFYVIAQRVILSPIRQLRALVNNVSEGNLDTRCAIKTGDEFETLAGAVNEMLDGLQKSQEQLRQANQQLDTKITELSDRNIELFKANKIKSEFLANISHEFRTPMNAILGFAEILREKGTKDRKSKRYAENIISSGRSLLGMINDLLDLAKAEAGKIQLHIEKTSIPELCRGIVAFFTPLMENQKIKVKLKIDDNIPIIHTDTGKVQQILYNLLTNAVKFTPEKGKITVKAFMPDDNTVRISITDTGCGIAIADHEKIFEKFRQVDGSLTRNSDGSGLGLTISKELATMLAATLHVESEIGKGSTFSLDLPVAGNEEIIDTTS